MKTRRKKLRGVTLIEMIVVIAVFGILFSGVMILLPPVSRLMAKTTLEENNAAKVDNISRYIESSIKYANYVSVFEGDYSNVSNTTIAEKDAVIAFLDNAYDGKIDKNYKPAKGKVRILKIDNANGGKITETIYDFEIGDSQQKNSIGDNTLKTKITINGSANTAVINDDYYKDYSYFFKLGYCEMDYLDKTVTDSLSLTYDSTGKTYYGELIEAETLNAEGNVVKLYPFGKTAFTISTVTYKNTGGNYIQIPGDPSIPTPDRTIFRGPYYMATSSMGLINMVNSSINPYWRLDRDTNGKIQFNKPGEAPIYDSGIAGLSNEEKNDIKLKSSNAILSPTQFFYYPCPSDLDPTSADPDNIYIIYTLPSEIN